MNPTVVWTLTCCLWALAQPASPTDPAAFSTQGGPVIRTRTPEATKATPTAKVAAPSLATPKPAKATGVATIPAERNPSAPLFPSTNEKLSDAERIARLQRSIDNDKKELQALKQQLDDPNSEFYRIQTWFQKTDSEWQEVKKTINKSKMVGPSQQALDMEEEWDELRQKWERARDRFNLAIQERKAMQEKITLLPLRIEQDEQLLARLLAPSGGVRPATPDTPFMGPVKDDSQSRQKATGNAAMQGGQATGSANLAGGEGGSSQAGSATGASAMGGSPEEAGKPINKELEKARLEAQTKEREAKQAREKARTLSERLEALKKNIDIEEKFLKLAQERAQQLQKSHEAIAAEQRKKIAGHAPEQELMRLAEILQKITTRAGETHDEIRATTARLHDLREELSSLQSEKLAASEEAELKKKEAEAADKLVSDLQNPFTLRNILQWLLDHGVKLVVILASMILLHLFVKLGSRRIVHVLLCSRRGTERECENRAQTLVSVFRNAAAILIFGGGSLMMMDAVGIPIVPLMGGAAVMGLAVAFGAQNLIKDYFSGFMVLMEDQYGINDVVKIGETVGQVERLTLRVTVLRDLEGVVHFIPHGTINTVSNLSYGWSRSLFEVGVAYKEDADHVMQVIKRIGQEIRQDPAYSPYILDDLEMLGVDAFGDSEVVIKFVIKTRPLKQWLIKREMLRRIKRRFDELGIEIPFPHRTVFHRYEGAVNSMEPPLEESKRLAS